MDSQTSIIEEIPRNDFPLPQIRLKVIKLNFNDKSHSAGTTSIPSFSSESSSDMTLTPYVRRPLQLKKTHKLRSFDHFLKVLDNKPHHQNSSNVASETYKRDLPNCNGHCRNNETIDKESQTEKIPDPDESVYIIFLRGVNESFSADQEEVVNTILNVLNKHVVSVGSQEHKIFVKCRKRSSKTCMNKIIMKTAFLAINELIDDGLAEITPQGLFQVAQGVTLTLCLHKTLIQFAKDVWSSRQAEFIRDAWMSFGGLAAVLVMSQTRQ